MNNKYNVIFYILQYIQFERDQTGRFQSLYEINSLQIQ